MKFMDTTLHSLTYIRGKTGYIKFSESIRIRDLVANRKHTYPSMNLFNFGDLKSVLSVISPYRLPQLEIQGAWG